MTDRSKITYASDFDAKKQADLITRYVNNYNLKKEEITISMILKHWNLEKELTMRLLASTRENRSAVFADAYSILYDRLPWLASTGSNVNERLSNKIYIERWLCLLGNIEDKEIYEIGSGNGKLISFLANNGAVCTGTEISKTRSDKQPQPNLRWHNTDGVNLLEFENPRSYDLILSDQVIEHLHPEDILLHFTNAWQLLKTHGTYFFYTPHYYIGPGDVSRIFDCTEARGMHLKEYKYAEMYRILKKAKFKKITILRPDPKKKISQLGFKIFLLLENSLLLLKNISLRKRLYHRLIRIWDISPEIIMSAHK